MVATAMIKDYLLKRQTKYVGMKSVAAAMDY